MSAPAQMPKQIGQARDGFTTDAGNWPPNVKSAHKKPSPTSAHLGLELLAVNQEAGIVEMAFNAPTSCATNGAAFRAAMLPPCWTMPWPLPLGSTLTGGKLAQH